MTRSRVLVIALLLAASFLWSLWQYGEYIAECAATRARVEQSAASMVRLLVGSVRSHRRVGPYFDEQMQAVLDDLVDSPQIRAAAIREVGGPTLIFAGETAAIDDVSGNGEAWSRAGFVKNEAFHLPADPGPGQGGGFGPGRGGGRGMRWQRGPAETLGEYTPTEAASSPFTAGGEFIATLVVDRSEADQECREHAWLRAMVALGGAMVLACVALAWQASVRLAQARGRSRVLETEARHYRDLSQAAAGLAHETRNPLGLIRGWTQRLAQSELASNEQRAQVRAVVEECDRLTARINQFLAFARPCETQLTTVEPATLATELRILLEPDLESRKVQLKLDSSLSSGRLLADREQLRQALFNLTQNAVQFAPPGSEVEISMRRGDDGHGRLEVADRGPGVSPGTEAMLFTPYYTTRPNGTGLGLAIVRRIAAAHGWQAGFGPRPGGGAVFWLEGVETINGA
ncbi:MAG: sensor histidine kinase [Planctomycetota bacterium]